MQENIKRVLIVVDMQNDFIDGILGTIEAEAIVPAVADKIRECTDDPQAMIVFTRDTHHVEEYINSNEGRHLPIMHCEEGSTGWQVRDELMEAAAIANDRVRLIDKPAFGYTGWANENFGNADIELVGVCTDICVVSNALIVKAVYPENNVKVDASCCAGTTPEAHRAALATMKSCQVDVFGE